MQPLPAAALAPGVAGSAPRQHFLALALGEPRAPQGADGGGRGVLVAVLDARGGICVGTLGDPGPALQGVIGSAGSYATVSPLRRSDLRSTDGMHTFPSQASVFAYACGVYMALRLQRESASVSACLPGCPCLLKVCNVLHEGSVSLARPSAAPPECGSSSRRTASDALTSPLSLCSPARCLAAANVFEQLQLHPKLMVAAMQARRRWAPTPGHLGWRGTWPRRQRGRVSQGRV